MKLNFIMVIDVVWLNWTGSSVNGKKDRLPRD